MTTSPTSASPDSKSVQEVLDQIPEQLAQRPHHDKSADNALKQLLQRLRSISNPLFTMNLLVPRLFLASSLSGFEGGTNVNTSHDALSTLKFLVSFDPDLYLKPASRAVRTTAEGMSSVSPDSTEPPALEVTDEVLSVLVGQLSSKEVEVASNATAAIAALCRALGPPLSERAVRAVHSAWRAASNLTSNTSEKIEATTICVRCASSIVDLTEAGDPAMEAAIECGATHLLLEMLTDSSDPLMQMSALDLLEKMATTLPMHGNRARWLFSKDVLHELLKMAGGVGVGNEGGEPDPILGGPALRVLSLICRLGQRDSSLFGLGGTELLTGFHHALHNFDTTSGGELAKLAYVDSVSSFASASPDTIALVLDDPTVRVGWLSLAVAQPKLKAVVLHSVANVIEPPIEKDSNGDSLQPFNIPSNQVAMRLFDMIGEVNNGDTTEVVMLIAKSPIVEARLGAYALLKAVAKRGMGAQVLLSHGGFFEFLMNRDLEKVKEGKEAKFEIIEAVMDSDAKGLLADSIVKQFEEVLKQGPHYVKTQPWELMLEE